MINPSNAELEGETAYHKGYISQFNEHHEESNIFIVNEEFVPFYSIWKEDQSSEIGHSWIRKDIDNGTEVTYNDIKETDTDGKETVNNDGKETVNNEQMETKEKEESHHNENYERDPLELTDEIKRKINLKKLQCDVCEFSTPHKSALRTHMRIHTGDKSYQCQHCDRRFRQKHHIEMHMVTHTRKKPNHSEIVKPFQCPYCDDKFGYKYSLNQHVLIHTGEKPYECSYCHISFRQISHLDRHFLTHTGKKPFECSHCNSKFKDKSTLDRHLRSHTKDA